MGIEGTEPALLERTMKNLTQEQAIALANTNWWVGLSARDVIKFQLFEDRLCMPFADFHRLLEVALGRPVWTHELASPENLQKEFLGEVQAPTFEEILDLIPEEKRVIAFVEEK